MRMTAATNSLKKAVLRSCQCVSVAKDKEMNRYLVLVKDCGWVYRATLVSCVNAGST